MRALIAGVIGAAASAAAWLGTEHFMQASFGWLVCLVGIVTGVCVHRASAGGAGGGIGRGALAVVLTLAAIVGGHKVYAKIMQANSVVTAAAVVIPKADATEVDGESETVESSETEVPALTAPELGEAAVGAGQRGYSKSAMQKNLSNLDMLWMSVAALAAYVTGKGSGKGSCAAPNKAGQGDNPDPQDDASGSGEE